jgi:GT2 family glycosyltransferase
MLAVDLCLPLGNVLQRLPGLDPYRVPPERWRPGAPVAHVIGAALAIRRAAYEAAGPLDEGFFLYLEETEWQERVRRAGYRVELVPDAEVVHLVRGGGDEALAPSPHFLASMRRYLRMRGHRERVVDAVIDGSLLLSRVAARAERVVVPADRRTGGARAQAYDDLWRAR